MKSKKLIRLLLLVVAFTVTGCISLSYGVSPNTDLLSSLTVGDSTEADVLLVLGEPRGAGRTSSYRDLDPRAIWFYEYLEADMSTARIELLLVFLINEKYDGHLWFSSFDTYQTESGTEVSAKPTAQPSIWEVAFRTPSTLDWSEYTEAEQIDDTLVRGTSTESDVLALFGMPTGSGSAILPPSYDPQDVLYYEDIQTGDIKNAPGGVIEIDMQQRVLLVFLQEGIFDGFMWYVNAHQAEGKSQ